MPNFMLVSQNARFFTNLPSYNDPRGGANFDPRGMVGRIYKGDQYTLLYTKYESSGPCGFGEEGFTMFSHDAPGAGPVWTPGAWLVGFIKIVTIHCYKQNMKAMGLVVSKKKIFFMFFQLLVYGSYLLPWKPEFQSDLAENLMQSFLTPMVLQIKFDRNWLTSCGDICF